MINKMYMIRMTTMTMMLGIEIILNNIVIIVFLSVLLLQDLHAGEQDFGEGSLRRVC